jgi:virginiamycin B lyase
MIGWGMFRARGDRLDEDVSAGRRRTPFRRRRPQVQSLEGRRLLSVTFRDHSIPSGLQPGEIVPGPDGNVWFTENVSTIGIDTISWPEKAGAIGRLTPGGTLSEFPLPPHVEPGSITAGPDGNVYFTESSLFQGRDDFLGVFRITPSGVVTRLNLNKPVGSGVSALTSGPDNALWGIEGTSIIRITLSGDVTAFPVDPGRTSFSVDTLTVGPDGSLWFSDYSYNDCRIGRMTPSGAFTEFSLPSGTVNVQSLTAGPDGNVYFTEGLVIASTGNTPKVGRITPAGVVTEFPPAVPSLFPRAITTGSDGNLWYTGSVTTDSGKSFSTTSKLVRLTPDGVATVYPIAVVDPGSTATAASHSAEGPAFGPVTLNDSFVGDITHGPDGHLYFTEFTTNFSELGRIVEVVLPSPPPPPPQIVGVNESTSLARPSRIVLAFSEPLNEATAQDLGNYSLAELGLKHPSGRQGGVPIRIRSAIYNPVTETVKLTVQGQFHPFRSYELTVLGTPGRGVTGQDGVALSGTGRPGTNYVTILPGLSGRPADQV